MTYVLFLGSPFKASAERTGLVVAAGVRPGRVVSHPSVAVTLMCSWDIVGLLIGTQRNKVNHDPFGKWLMVLIPTSIGTLQAECQNFTEVPWESRQYEKFQMGIIWSLQTEHWHNV